MSNSLNKKLAEMLGKIDDKVLETKLNAALDMLSKGNTDELAKKINKMDKNELMAKINEFDESKLKELNISTEEIKKNINDADLEKLSRMVGENGDQIMRKIREILK